jgi:hypothetical protein
VSGEGPPAGGEPAPEPRPDAPFPSQPSPAGASFEPLDPSAADPSAAPEPPPPPRTRRVKPDPWAHRRGEPRIFAFVWTVYLFLATAATMLSTVAKGFPGPEVMRPAARVLLLTVALGVAIVWPLIRLSQARDRSPVSATVQDLFVVLIPVQAVVWPQTLWWLAHWPASVVAGEAALLGAWSLVVGGMLALALAGPERAGTSLRWGWMALLVALVGLGALPALAGAGPAPGGGDVLVREMRPAWMLSPFTAVLELSRDRSWSGLPPRPVEGHWLMILATTLAAAPLWLAASLRSQATHARQGNRDRRSGRVRGGSGGGTGGAGLAAGEG